MNNIHKIGHIIYQTGFRTVQFLTLLLMSILTICSLFWGYYAEEMDTQTAISHNEPFLLHLLGMLVLIFLLFLLLWISSLNHAPWKRAFLLTASLCWVCFWGVFLVRYGRATPSADSNSVYTLAQALASGQMGVIHPTDSYLSFYPQQVGLVAYYETIIRLETLLRLPYASYTIIQYTNVLMACAIVFFQYKITWLLSHNDAATITYLFLAILNMPLIFYTSFVYGEIPSFAFLSGGLYLLLAHFEKQELPSRRRFLYLACSLVMLVLGVALRKNSLIIVIAVVLIILWEWLRQHRTYLLLYGTLLIICSLAVLPVIQHIYEYRAGNVLSTGVPAISYIAMGMQESSRGDGWYNGFNFYTYEASNLNTAVTTQESKAAIRESLAFFQTDPGYAFRFYRNKFLSQWTDGSYFCRQATLTHTDARKEIIETLYTGKLATPFIHYCNIYQLLVYGGSLTCLLSQWHHRKTKTSAPKLPFYVGMIAVLGGFIFHMLWEANSRYILPYFLLLLPYAAQGLGMLYSMLLMRHRGTATRQS